MNYCVHSVLARKQTVVNFGIRTISRLPKRKHLVNIIENMMAEDRKQSSSERTELKFGKYPGHSNRIESVGSGSHGGPRSAFLCVNEMPYLFNCGEGVQRLCSEYRVKLSKLKYAFITYPSWKNIVGLYGVMLDLQVLGCKDFYIYGHPCIVNVFRQTNRFVALKQITIHFEDIFEENELTLENVKVTKVFLYPSPSSVTDLNKDASEPKLPGTSEEDTPENEKLLQDYDDTYVDYYSHLSRNRKRARIIFKQKNEKRARSESSSIKEVTCEKFALSYICKLKKILGTLLVEKCVTLGVPPGQLLGQLKNGQDVVLSDGRVIKSSDVKSPDIPGDIVIIVECPSEDYLDSLLNEPKFFKHQSNDNHPELLAAAVVHFSSSDIMENPKYREWMNRFPSQTKHLIINDGNKWTGSVGIHRMQVKMNLIHPELFPLLHESHIVFKEIGKSSDDSEVIEVLNSNQKEGNGNLKLDDEEFKGVGKTFYKLFENSVIQADAMCSVFLNPKKKYDYSKLFVIKEFFLNEALQNEGFSEEVEKLKVAIKKMEPITNEYPKILFLGTGSGKPSKTRNSSGILICLNGNDYILLDCGEGTYCQIVRFFGKDKARDILRNLKAIFISHLHPDHHLGLNSILIEKKNLMYANKLDSTCEPHHKPILLLAPGQMLKWLKVFNRDLEKISVAYELIPNDTIEMNNKKSQNSEKIFESTNLDVTTASVCHVLHSFGISITHKDGWKLTYSGDTMPSDNLIKIGQDSDVLIHEATLDESLKEEAARKLHSTNAEAIEVGKKMNAKFTLLTHFSQRYHYSPFFNKYFNENVGVAYDNMLVSLGQLKILPKLTNSLKLVFLNHYERLEELHNKSQRTKAKSKN